MSGYTPELWEHQGHRITVRDLVRALNEYGKGDVEVVVVLVKPSGVQVEGLIVEVGEVMASDDRTVVITAVVPEDA